MSTGPHRSPTIHQVRYGSTTVGEQEALGSGLTYTGVTSGGGFEDQLYAARTDDAGSVHGRQAVVSNEFGGNATLACSEWRATNPQIIDQINEPG